MSGINHPCGWFIIALPCFFHGFFQHHRILQAPESARRRLWCPLVHLPAARASPFWRSPRWPWQPQAPWHHGTVCFPMVIVDSLHWHNKWLKHVETGEGKTIFQHQDCFDNSIGEEKRWLKPWMFPLNIEISCKLFHETNPMMRVSSQPIWGWVNSLWDHMWQGINFQKEQQITI